MVYDNNGKDLGSCQALIDHFSGYVQQFIFVASAGAYVANDIEPMHVEGDPRKEQAGHVQVRVGSCLASLTIAHPVYEMSLRLWLLACSQLVSMQPACGARCPFAH